MRGGRNGWCRRTSRSRELRRSESDQCDFNGSRNLQFTQWRPCRLDRFELGDHFADHVALRLDQLENGRSIHPAAQLCIREQSDLFRLPISPVAIIGAPIEWLAEIAEALRKVGAYVSLILPRVVTAAVGNPDHCPGIGFGQSVQIL